MSPKGQFRRHGSCPPYPSSMAVPRSLPMTAALNDSPLISRRYEHTSHLETRRKEGWKKFEMELLMWCDWLPLPFTYPPPSLLFRPDIFFYPVHSNGAISPIHPSLWLNIPQISSPSHLSSALFLQGGVKVSQKRSCKVIMCPDHTTSYPRNVQACTSLCLGN